MDVPDAEAHASYAAVPNGPVPMKIASGQRPTAFEPEFSAEICDGALTSSYDQPGSAAAYFGVEVDRPVKEMGAVFDFEGAPAEKASIGLIAWTSAFDSFPPAPRSAPVHLTINPVSWAVEVWEEGVLRTVYHEYFGGLRSEGEVVSAGTNLPTDGTPLMVEWRISGDRLTVHLPNGEAHSVSDPAIGAIQASWPTPELYFDTGVGAPRVAIRSWRANA